MSNSLLLIIPLAAYLVLSYRAPLVALYLAIVATPLYIVRFTVWGLPTNLFETLVILLALVVGAQITANSPKTRTHFPRELVWGCLLLLAGLVIGLAGAPDRLVALGIIKSWFAIPFILMLLVWRLVPKEKANWISPALLLSTLPLSIMAITQVVTGHFVTIDGRASAWFASANYLTLYLVPILLLSLGWLLSKRDWKTSVGWLVWLLGLVAVYFSFSFGGWLAGALGALVFAAIASRHPRWLGYGLGIIVLGAGLLYFVNPRFAELFHLSERSSGSVRLQVWAASLLMIKEHWLTGLGLGSFVGNYLAYAKRLFHPPIETIILHPHNLFLQFWISLGLPGLVGFFVIVIQWWRKLVASTPSLTQAGLAGAMTAVLAHGLIDTSYFKNDLSIIFWLLVAMVYLPYVQHT